MSAKRFRAAVGDAVREGLPLQQCIKLGIISGTSKNEGTPESEGKEYKPTKDQFVTAVKDALARGASTCDAIGIGLTMKR